MGIPPEILIMIANENNKKIKESESNSHFDIEKEAVDEYFGKELEYFDTIDYND